MRTIDKIKVALQVELTLIEAYVAWFTTLAIITALLGLLAIGGGR